ncbi:MAG TPA: sulfotransferase [Steroidobacteraceae bacterium]|nr:sulfotransferase [Steroidobacteraceae bacterium]
MLLNWLNAREATEVGTALADDFVLQNASGAVGTRAAGLEGKQLQKFLQRFLQRVDQQTRPLKLNVFKRAKLANSFKWRLLEKGVEKPLVEELTHALVLQLTSGKAGSPLPAQSPAASAGRAAADNAQTLLTKGIDHVRRGEYAEAVVCYQDSLRLDGRNPVTRNNLGAALCRVGEYQAAEEQFRRAIGAKANNPEAHFNLGTLLRLRGQIVESEMPLRRALKLKPGYVDAQVSLGATLTVLGRLRDAKDLLEKALKLDRRNVGALVSLGFLLAREGRFAEAEELFNRAQEIEPKAPDVWVGLAGLKKMTPADAPVWLKGAQASADNALEPLSEARIRYAIGKCYDDIGDYSRAFRSYQRANELMKTGAFGYDRDARKRFVDDMVRLYTREALSDVPKGGSDSTLPVFVVGMPRSGTSLVEQIIASHPAARGAGEVRFWGQAFRKHATRLSQELPDQTLRKQLAEGYLRTLAHSAGGAQRVVDKSTFNSDYLGIIRLVLPKARVIYVQRDPVDTCLSCYFQDFPGALNFTLDLSDLASYCQEHQRLMAHWRSALPPGVMLDVPYAELIADQETWTRRMVEFLGLEWDERCLEFHRTERSVLTTSYWQVRQKMYASSVGRWRNYQKFIGPLLELKDVRS